MEIQPVDDTDLSDVRRKPTFLDTADEKASGVQAARAHRVENAGSRSQRREIIVSNRYLLQRRIGRGHLGEIFEAVDQRLSNAGQRNYCVAIELVTLDRSQKQIRERLVGEFVNLLSVSHPNIARIMDFGTDGATSFFTTELLEGASLSAILDCAPAEPLTETEVLAVIGSVADALRHIHAKGIVHRDLRPESILVTCNYEVKLVDLASAVLARAGQSSAEMRFGGNTSWDSSDDVFGLACLAYELLANEQPFGDVPTDEAFRMRLRPRRIKGVPRYRWKALSRALELRSKKRTLTVAEFAAEFGLTGTETLIAPEPKKKPRRRGFVRLVLWLAVTAGMIALVQSNYTTLRDLPAAWKGEIGGRQNPALLQEGESERLNSALTEPITIGDPTRTDANPPRSDPFYDAIRSLNVGVEREDRTPALTRPAAAIAPSEPVPAAVEAQGPVEPGAGSNPLFSASMGDRVDTAPPGFAFAQETVTVSEGEGMASFVIQRLRGADGGASVTWWTRDNTAIANDDYADLGLRTETFLTGQENLTVYVPLISDSLLEERETFSVYLSWDSAPADLVEGLEVVVIDDDY